MSDDGSEQRDDDSSCQEDYNDAAWDSGSLEPDQPLSNDDVCAQMCEHIASLYISKDTILNGTHRGRRLVSGGTLRSHCPLRSLDRKRDMKTCHTKGGSSYIQPYRFCHTATETLQPINTCHTATKPLQPICTSDHESKGTVVTEVHDGSDFSLEEQCKAMPDEIDFSKETCTAVHDGSDLSQEEQSTAMHDECKVDASTVVHDGKDFCTETSTVVHDGKDFCTETSTVVHDGKDFCKVDASTVVHDGNDFCKETSTAVPDRNDFCTETSTVVHDGNDLCTETSTVVHDGNDLCKDSSTAMDDGSDFSKEETCSTVQDGNDLDEESKTEHDGNDVIKGEEHKAVCDLIDGSNDRGEDMSTAVSGGRRDSVTEMQTTPSHRDDSSNVLDLEVSVSKIQIPTPTQDESPYELNLYLSGSQSGTPVSDVSSLNTEEPSSRSVTPTQDELPCDPESYLYDGCSVATVLDSGVVPVGSNHNVESSAYLPQYGNEPFPSGMHICTQRPPSALGEPFSFDSPASDQDSEDSHKPQPLSEDESNFSSSTSSEEISHCTDIRPHTHEELHTADEESITLSKGNHLPQELSCSDSLHRNSKANRQSEPTEDGLCVSSSLVSEANPQNGAIIPSKDDSLTSQSEPAGSCGKAANTEDDYGRDPKMASDTVSPPSPQEAGSAEISLSCPAIAGTSSEDPKPIEESQQNPNRSSSKSKDGNVVDLLDSSSEVIPTSNQTNDHLSEDDFERCHSVTGSQSKLHADCLHPHQPFSDGKDVTADHESLSDSNPLSQAKHSNSSPDPGSDSSTAVLDSVYREHDSTRTSAPAGNFQDSDQNGKRCISPVFATSPPVPASGRPHTPRKRLRKSARAFRSQECQGGSDIRLAVERRNVRMEASSDHGTAARDSSKSFAQEEDIERYNMLGDRESVSSGSFSDDVGGKDAVGSPIGEDSSSKQEIDEVFDSSKAGPFNPCSDQSEGTGWSWASCSVSRKGNYPAERDRFCNRRVGRKHDRQTCVTVKEEDEGPAVRPSTITVFDYRGKRRTYENYPITTMVSNEPTVPARDGEKKGHHLHSFLQEWKKSHRAHPDLTQSSLDMQYLIFSEQMNQILKKNWPNAQTSHSARYPWRKRSSSDVDCSPSQVSQDLLSEERGMKRKKHVHVGPRDPEFSPSCYPLDSKTPQRLRRLSQASGSAEPSSVVSNIAVECSRSYRTVMNNVCSGKQPLHRPNRPQSERTLKPHRGNSCKQMKEDHQRSNVKAAAGGACKGKFRFYILATSEDAFFEHTKVGICKENSYLQCKSCFGQQKTFFGTDLIL